MKDHNTLRYLRPVDTLELGAPLRLKKPTPADAAEAEFASWQVTAPSPYTVTIGMTKEVFSELVAGLDQLKFSIGIDTTGHYVIRASVQVPKHDGGILEQYNANVRSVWDGARWVDPGANTGSVWQRTAKALKSRNEALELAGWAVAPLGEPSVEPKRWKSAYDEFSNEMMGVPYQSAHLAQLANTHSVTVTCDSNASEFAKHIAFLQKQIAGAMGLPIGVLQNHNQSVSDGRPSDDLRAVRDEIDEAISAAVRRGATHEMIMQARYDAGVPHGQWAYQQRPEVAAQFLEIINRLCTAPAQKETPTWRTARALRQLLTNVMGVDLSTVAGLPPPPVAGSGRGFP